MTKKILLLVGLVILLTGCTAEVNLVVDESYVKENISINTIATQEYDLNTIRNAYRSNLPAFSKDIIVDTEADSKKKGVSYYKYSIKEIDNGYNIKYAYNFKIDRYNEARSINEAYKNHSVIYDKDKKIITIDTDSSGCQYFGIYPELTGLKINIKSAYEVIDTNADKCEDGVCTWSLTPSNNKKIYIKLDTNNRDDNIVIDKETVVDDEELDEEDESSNNSYIYILVFGGIIGFIIVVLFVNKKMK